MNCQTKNVSGAAPDVICRIVSDQLHAPAYSLQTIPILMGTRLTLSALFAIQNRRLGTPAKCLLWVALLWILECFKCTALTKHGGGEFSTRSVLKLSFNQLAQCVRQHLHAWRHYCSVINGLKRLSANWVLTFKYSTVLVRILPRWRWPISVSPLLEKCIMLPNKTREFSSLWLKLSQ